MGCEFVDSGDQAAIEAALLTLRNRLADLGAKRIGQNRRDRFASELSKRLGTRASALAQWIADLSTWQRHPLPVVGAFFAPWPVTDAKEDGAAHGINLLLWRHFAEATRQRKGRRTGLHPVTVFSVAALGALGLWSAGMVLSGISNAHQIVQTSEALAALKQAPDTAARLRALMALQQRIGFYEYRTQHHAPLFSRFGLSHDREALAALWTPYARESRALLAAPIQQDLEARLVDLGQMPTTQVDDQLTHVAQDGQGALKTYLMMSFHCFFGINSFHTPLLLGERKNATTPTYSASFCIGSATLALAPGRSTTSLVATRCPGSALASVRTGTTARPERADGPRCVAAY